MNLPSRAEGRSYDDPMHLQFIRLRLPGFRRPVHVLREAGPTVRGGTWSGAEWLHVEDGHLRAAHSRQRLRRDHRSAHPDASTVEARVLVLDLVQARRDLLRPSTTWSGTTRGTFAELDDLVWDAAASLDDQVAGRVVSDAAGMHAQYLHLWGQRPEPLETAQRIACWDESIAWLLGRLLVLDRWDRRYLDRR